MKKQHKITNICVSFDAQCYHCNKINRVVLIYAGKKAKISYVCSCGKYLTFKMKRRFLSKKLLIKIIHNLENDTG